MNSEFNETNLPPVEGVKIQPPAGYPPGFAEGLAKDREEIKEAADLMERRILANNTALEQWRKTVTEIIRHARGLKPEDFVELPSGETGRYIRHAFDNKGRLSLGKKHGRMKQRPNKAAFAISLIGQRLFTKFLVKEFHKFLVKEFHKSQTQIGSPDTPTQTTAEINQKCQRNAARQAEREYNGPIKAQAKAARRRQQTSRRINAGLIPGGADRRSHAAA